MPTVRLLSGPATTRPLLKLRRWRTANAGSAEFTSRAGTAEAHQQPSALTVGRRRRVCCPVEAGERAPEGRRNIHWLLTDTADHNAHDIRGGG